MVAMCPVPVVVVNFEHLGDVFDSTLQQVGQLEEWQLNHFESILQRRETCVHILVRILNHLCFVYEKVLMENLQQTCKYTFTWGGNLFLGLTYFLCSC